VIFASYSDDLGVRTNNSIQRMLDSDLFKSVFPEIRLGERTEIWRRNASLLEFAGREGSFRNVTVEGAINGMELSFGVIDDPHKGRNEALSKATRDKVWNWFTDDWMARFSTNSAMLVIATRWHIDGLIGRYLERDPDMKIVSYPAIAEKDEFWQDSSKPLRRIGQASSAPDAPPTVRRRSTSARRSSSTSTTTPWKTAAASIWCSMSSAATSRSGPQA
jgi:hypothetical protein